MKEKLFKVLDFFRITDDDQRLSLTHLVIFVAIYKVLVAPVFTISEVTTLLIAMFSYGFKKHLMKNKAAVSDENKLAITKIEQRIAQLADKQSGIATAMGFKPTTQK